MKFQVTKEKSTKISDNVRYIVSYQTERKKKIIIVFSVLQKLNYVSAKQNEKKRANIIYHEENWQWTSLFRQKEIKTKEFFLVPPNRYAITSDCISFANVVIIIISLSANMLYQIHSSVYCSKIKWHSLSPDEREWIAKKRTKQIHTAKKRKKVKYEKNRIAFAHLKRENTLTFVLNTMVAPITSHHVTSDHGTSHVSNLEWKNEKRKNQKKKSNYKTLTQNKNKKKKKTEKAILFSRFFFFSVSVSVFQFYFDAFDKL